MWWSYFKKPVRLASLPFLLPENIQAVLMMTAVSHRISETNSLAILDRYPSFHSIPKHLLVLIHFFWSSSMSSRAQVTFPQCPKMSLIPWVFLLSLLSLLSGNNCVWKQHEYSGVSWKVRSWWFITRGLGGTDSHGGSQADGGDISKVLRWI